MQIDSIFFSPLFSLFITIGSYSLALWLHEKFNNNAYLNPAIVAIVLVVVYLVYFDIPYESYLQGVSFINTLLGTATVALAIPLYKQVASIKRAIRAIIFPVISSCFIAAISAYYLAEYLGASEDIKLSIMPKSVTVPIAIAIAEKIGSEPSLTVLFVFSTGIIGSLIAPMIFTLFNIRDEKSIGFSLGVTCHGLGLVRAFQHSQVSGVFSVVGMSLMGLFSGLILPIFIIELFM